MLRAGKAKTMLKYILHWARAGSAPTTRTCPTGQVRGPAIASNVRALATGAALAVSVDTSPAVLVSIYDYAHRYRDKPRRCA